MWYRNRVNEQQLNKIEVSEIEKLNICLKRLLANKKSMPFIKSTLNV